jgi:peptidoglycan hydrolase FlgJ
MDSTISNTNNMANQPAIDDVDGKKKAEELKKIKKACQDFESIFTYYLLKTMRQTVPKGSTISGFAGRDTYNMIMDQKVAEDLSRKGNGLGLNKILYDQMTKNYKKEDNGNTIK